MATQQVVVSGRCDLPISPGSDVVVCLDSEWGEFTVSGYPLIYGTVTVVNRVREVINQNCCTTYTFANERCDYTVQFEDDQLIDDPDTAEPYVLEDEDTVSIFGDVCVVQALLAGPFES